MVEIRFEELSSSVHILQETSHLPYMRSESYISQAVCESAESCEDALLMKYQLTTLSIPKMAALCTAMSSPQESFVGHPQQRCVLPIRVRTHNPQQPGSVITQRRYSVPSV